MRHNILKSKHASRQTITVKTAKTLEQYKEIVFLTRDYFKAIKKGHQLPKQPLPSLPELLEANMIVETYLKNQNFGLTLKLWSACLSTEQVVAVWFFANEPTVNVRLGDHQMFVVKHHNPSNNA